MLTLAGFISSEKQLFLKDKFMILVAKGRCKSTGNFSISAGMPHTEVAFKLSRFKTFFCTKFIEKKIFH